MNEIVDFRREGRKRLSARVRVSEGGLRSLDGKGPPPMHPDAASGIQMHSRRPFHFQTE